MVGGECQERLGEERMGELLFNGYRVSAFKIKIVLEMVVGMVAHYECTYYH